MLGFAQRVHRTFPKAAFLGDLHGTFPVSDRFVAPLALGSARVNRGDVVFTGYRVPAPTAGGTAAISAPMFNDFGPLIRWMLVALVVAYVALGLTFVPHLLPSSTIANVLTGSEGR